MPTFDFGLGSDNNSGNTNEPIKEPTTSLDEVLVEMINQISLTMMDSLAIHRLKKVL